jgi:hypothetical protein
VPQTQVFDSLVLQEFLRLNEGILKRKFPERNISSNRGRPRLGLLWVLAAICVFARSQNIVWRDLPSKLSYCHFLIDEGFLLAIPSKSTFHRVWKQVTASNISNWIRIMGYQDGGLDSEDITIDSSSIELRSGSFWRLVKWNRSLISKTSTIFNKVHLAVALPSRSIVGIHVSEAKKFDSRAFGPLILSVHKRLLANIK